MAIAKTKASLIDLQQSIAPLEGLKPEWLNHWVVFVDLLLASWIHQVSPHTPRIKTNPTQQKLIPLCLLRTPIHNCIFTMSAPQRTIGRDGPKVSAMGLGLMSIGSAYGQAGPLDETVAFLDHAHATGQRFWDTADAYQDSEDIIGEWFKRSGKRDDIFIATKFGFVPDEGKITVRSDPEHARAACETSLKRLGINTIDLYYCHRLDGITPIEKTIEALVDLKK